MTNQKAESNYSDTVECMDILDEVMAVNINIMDNINIVEGIKDVLQTYGLTPPKMPLSFSKARELQLEELEDKISTLIFETVEEVMLNVKELDEAIEAEEREMAKLIPNLRQVLAKSFNELGSRIAVKQALLEDGASWIIEFIQWDLSQDYQWKKVAKKLAGMKLTSANKLVRGECISMWPDLVDSKG